MQHLSAWYESIDPANALVPIAAVPDQSVFTSGDDIRVPNDLPFIIGQTVLGNDASLVRGQLQSPSLRSFANVDIEPVVAAAVFGNPPEALYHPFSPIPVSGDESINVYVQSDPAAAAAHYGLVWFGDGAQQAVPGEIFTVRATAAAALAAGTWVNSGLTFSQSLPVGNYQIVGMRARGTNLVAARLVFVGGAWRPGVPAVNAIGDRDIQLFRYGRSGVFGEFNTNTPPTVDCLGITDTSQILLLDLVRTG